MPTGRDSLPDKKEERDPLSTVIVLAPLFCLIVQIIELMLKILGTIK